MYVFIDCKHSYKKSYVEKRVDLQKYIIEIQKRDIEITFTRYRVLVT